MVHSKDVQEVSKGSPVLKKPTLPGRKATVGTLLLSPKELNSPVSENSEPLTVASIRRRVTNRLNGPAPSDQDVETWAD